MDTHNYESSGVGWGGGTRETEQHSLKKFAPAAPIMCKIIKFGRSVAKKWSIFNVYVLKVHFIKSRPPPNFLSRDANVSDDRLGILHVERSPSESKGQ